MVTNGVRLDTKKRKEEWDQVPNPFEGTDAKPLTDASQLFTPSGGTGGGGDSGTGGGDSGPPQIFTNESGTPSGITINGRTFFGLGPDEVKEIANREIVKRQIPEGSLSVADQAKLNRSKNLASSVGNLTPTAFSAQPSEIDKAQLGGAIIAGIAPDLIRGGVYGAGIGAGIGATAGALGGPAAPLTIPGGALSGAVSGALIGAVSNALIGAYNDAKSNIAAQRAGDITASAGTLSNGKSNLNKLIREQHRNPANADANVADFNEQLSLIERDYQVLKLDTEGFIKDLTGKDGTPQLAAYDRFYNSGERDLYIQRMQDALRNPDPNKIQLTEEEFSNLQMGE